MNQAKPNASDDLFTTETAGLPEVLGPDVTRLADGGRLDLRIGPVRKNIDGAELRRPSPDGLGEVRLAVAGLLADDAVQLAEQLE